MRILRRFPHRAMLVLAVLAVAPGVPHAGHPAAAAASAPAAASRPVTAVTVAARQPADQGGICSVPGIGDIGGLFGFCSPGNSRLSGDLNHICSASPPDPETAP